MIIQTLATYILLMLVIYLSTQAFVRAQMPFSKKIYFYIPMLIFAVVFGARYGVGIDYYSYVRLFDASNGWSDWNGWDDFFEPGIIAVLDLCKRLHLSSIVFLSILAFLQTFFLYKTFEKNKNQKVLPYIMLFCVLTGIAMGGFMNVIRQSIAFCIFVYSLRFVENKSFLKYALYITLAVCFHKSALLLYPLYFLWIHRDALFTKVSIQLVLYGISFVLLLINPFQYLMNTFDSLISVFGYDRYVGGSFVEGDRTFGIGNLPQVAVFVLIILQSNELKHYFNSRLFNIFYDLFFIGICANNILFGSLLFGRVIMYCTDLLFVILAYYFVFLKNQYRLSVFSLIALCVFIVYIIYQFAWLMYYSEQNTFQFVFIFQEELHAIKDMQFEQYIRR